MTTGPRPVPEWIGKTSLTRIPREIKDRILLRFHGGCADCTRLFGPRLKPQFDHRPPLHNGGENRESKIEPVCAECHRIRSDEDTVKRAAIKRYRAKLWGLQAPSKHPVPGGKRTKWKKKYNKLSGRFETVRRVERESKHRS
ncbi:MAG: HNH endonuclease [Microvirga sp.]